MDKENIINNVLDNMSECLNKEQLNELRMSLENEFFTESVKINKGNMELVEEYCQAKKDEGLSANSIKAYKTEVVKFLLAVNMNVREIDKNVARKYLSNYRNERNISDVTANNMRRYISSFFTWLVNEEIITSNQIKKLPPIKEKKKVKQVIKEYDLEVLKDSATNYRDRAILEVLDCTGVRVSELCSLNRDDIVDGVAVITGKGNKEREIYFSDKCNYYLKKYLKTRKDDNPALFVNLRKRPDGKYYRVEIHSIETMVKNLGDKNNISKIHPHAFRRTTCTRLLCRNMPIQEVQEFMGHSQIGTTILYNTNNRNSIKLHSQLLV